MELATTASPAAPAVGDVHSSEPGTGARFNGGKVTFDLLPILPLVRWEEKYGQGSDRAAGDLRERAFAVLGEIGRWQAGDEAALDRALAATGAVTLEDFADCARVFDWGRVVKYKEWNWAKGMSWSVALGCIIRHCNAIRRGEQNDHETGLPTMAHVQCNLVMLLTWRDTFLSGDDRPVQLLAGTLKAADHAH